MARVNTFLSSWHCRTKFPLFRFSSSKTTLVLLFNDVDSSSHQITSLSSILSIYVIGWHLTPICWCAWTQVGPYTSFSGNHLFYGLPYTTSNSYSTDFASFIVHGCDNINTSEQYGSGWFSVKIHAQGQLSEGLRLTHIRFDLSALFLIGGSTARPSDDSMTCFLVHPTWWKEWLIGVTRPDGWEYWMGPGLAETFVIACSRSEGGHIDPSLPWLPSNRRSRVFHCGWFKPSRIQSC